MIVANEQPSADPVPEATPAPAAPNPGWANHAEHILNRAAHWVLAEVGLAKADWTSLEQDDPLLAAGLKVVASEAEARCPGVMEAGAVSAQDLLKVVQDVATATDTPFPAPPPRARAVPAGPQS